MMRMKADGRRPQTKAPEKYRKEISASAMASLACEKNYYNLPNDDEEEEEANDHEIDCVEAGLGAGFETTRELHVVKYKQAMIFKDKDKWDKAVFEEHERIVKITMWLVVPK
jgi:hypothetical protein